VLIVGQHDTKSPNDVSLKFTGVAKRTVFGFYMLAGVYPQRQDFVFPRAASMVVTLVTIFT
jgi:hypothetical protein